MRIARVARPAGPAFGVVQEDLVVLMDTHPFGDFTLTHQIAPLDKVRVLAPIIPSKILCVGKNYVEHADELGTEVPAEPLIFGKPATAVIGPDDEIRLPALSELIHHEGELAVVIGRLTRKVSPADALSAVLGYTCANDVTARDLQQRDGQWTRAKGFDTFCPLGPWIETELAVEDGLRVQTRVNGVLRPDGTTADLVFDIATIVSFCAAFTTLLPGDVILTGTPKGVGPIVAGDTVEVEVEGIGTLSNPAVPDD
jgi:2-keto-4-pentenoate hydratase/2-oxohepta-3-ene-1,7-dioic acid hydratase in catechol pathway